VVVMLEQALTKGEQSLVRQGRGEKVIEIRHELQEAMRRESSDAVAELTGRTVTAMPAGQPHLLMHPAQDPSLRSTARFSDQLRASEPRLLQKRVRQLIDPTLVHPAEAPRRRCHRPNISAPDDNRPQAPVSSRTR
jgi:hypothetical protein